MTLSNYEYQDALDASEGYCASCGYITTSQVEPDILPCDKRQCMECERSDSLYGLESAFIAGVIDVEFDDYA